MLWNCNVHDTACVLKTFAQLNRPFSCSHVSLLGISKRLWCHQFAKMSPKDFVYNLHVQKTKYFSNV